MTSRTSTLTLAFALLTVAACATPQRLAPEPTASMAEANVGVSNVRFLVARDTSAFQAEALTAIAKEKAWLAARALLRNCRRPITWQSRAGATMARLAQAS